MIFQMLPMSADSIQFVILADTSPLVQWVVLAAAVVGTGIVLFKPKFRPKKDPLARSPESSSLAQQRSVERQMQNLLVELSEMSRQITAGLDTRAARLDALIREADAKIATLSALGNGFAGAEQRFAMPAEPPTAERMDSFPGGHSAGGHSAGGFDLPASTMPPSPYDVDPRHAAVYLLADQGQSPAEIAGQMQRPAGEIQLILALRAR